MQSASRFSTASAFLSTDSSFDRTRLSYFCSSDLRSLVSFSSSFFVLRDSSFTSNKASLFFVSAVFKASSMMLLALSSAVPTTSASFCTLLLTATLQVIGTAISSATATATIATMIVIATGAPPYLVFIVQIQQYKFSCFLGIMSSFYLCYVHFFKHRKDVSGAESTSCQISVKTTHLTLIKLRSGLVLLLDHLA